MADRDDDLDTLRRIRARITTLSLAENLPPSVWSDLCLLDSDLSELCSAIAFRPAPPRPTAADVVNARHAADMLATTAPPSDAHPAWDDTRHDLVGSLRRVLAWVEMTGGGR